jgi:hypothetical protein
MDVPRIFFFIITWLLLLVGTALVARALLVGEIRVQEVAYVRARQPSAYWFEVTAAALAIALAAALVAQMQRHPTRDHAVNPVLVLFTVALLRFVAQSLWHGRARLPGSDYPRTQPREYWIIVLASGAFCALGGYVIVGSWTAA